MADVRLTPTAQQTLDQHSRPEEPSAVFKPTDMSNWAQIHALWDFALQTYGRVNIVVNGAGVYEPPSSTFWNPPGASTESSSLPLIPGVAAPEDDPDAAVGQYKTFAVNMTGPIRLAQLAVQYWLEHREVGGNLLWFASLAGYLHGMITPLYFSSKAAVVSMCKSLGGLRETRGVRNACICPGTVHSPIIDEDQKHIIIRPDDIGMTPKESAEIALRILQEPQYGDGNVVECFMAENAAQGGEQTIRMRDLLG